MLPPIAKLRHPRIFWAAVLLLAVTAAWPLLSQSGLLNTRGGGDSPFLLQRLQQLVVALRDGHFPVRWMPDANYGFGYPFFNFYASLSIYIAAAFRFLGFSYVGAIKAAQLSGFLVAGIGTFYLGRRWFKSDCAGLLAAAAYTFAPFHMVNIYVRGDSLAEFWAMAFYPLLLITADDLVHQPKRPLRIALFALTYAALILSHNISALIFSPFLFLYLALALWKKFGKQPTSAEPGQTRPSRVTKPQTILFIILALLLALALSAWFWLPAISEQNLAQLEPVTAGYFHFSNHFREADLIQNSLLFNYNVADGAAFRMGLLQLTLILAGLTVVWFKIIKDPKAPLLPALLITASFLIATLMITPLSRPLWNNLPLLPFTQFPWRFLSVQALFGALAVGGLALLPGHKLIVPLLTIGIALSSLGNLQTDHLYLTDADITAKHLAEYEWFTGNIGSTVSAEYLPPSIQPRSYTGPWLNISNRLPFWRLNDEVEVQPPVSQETDEQIWRMSTTSPSAAVTLPVVAWPGWQVTVDGALVDNHPAPGTGLITFPLPSGQHTVELRFKHTPGRITAELISLAAILIVGWLLWPSVRQYTDRKRLTWSAAAVLCLVLVAIGLRLWPISYPSLNTLSWDFEQRGYLHHSPDGIPFENDLLLHHYDYSQHRVSPGKEITITLVWENGNGTTAEITLTTPMAQQPDAAPTLVSQTQPVQSGTAVYRLVIPANAPVGLYVPRLTVNDAKSLTDSGHLRGDLYLQPLEVLSAAERAPQDSPPLDVRAVNVAYQSPTLLQLQLQWLTLTPLPKNYIVSLRLIDTQGLLVTQQDTQPGFGFLPSSSWLPGRWEDDWLTLPLPDSLTAEQTQSAPYALVARLYDLQTEEVLLTRLLGQMTWQEAQLRFEEMTPVFDLPPDISPTAATFEELIQLEGYTLEETVDSLNVTLFWQALANGREDFSHFVHLVDPQTGDIVAQHDSMPRSNTYPTSQWVSSEIIADNAPLNLTDVPAGEYLLYVGLYRNLGDTFPPLTGLAGDGQLLPNNRLLLETIIINR